jgi:divalent metal cation (Fe/Co/Zn/Cd) transporter
MSTASVIDPRASSRWTRIALWLVGATMAYNVVEAVLAVSFGLEAESIALLGFGLDSIIEVTAAGALFWRLRVEARGADSEAVERAEDRVRFIVGLTFIALALFVTVQAGLTLWRAEPPSATVPGIILAVASLAIMPAIAIAKLRAADHLGSRALRAEARETLACSYLSLALLVGLAANAAFGWWWADPIAALLMVPWLVKEGRENLSGDDCGGCH